MVTKVNISAEARQYVRQRLHADSTRDLAKRTLLTLIDQNSVPCEDVSETCRREREAFGVIEDFVRNEIGRSWEYEYVPVDPAIEKRPEYTVPRYVRNSGAQAPSANAIYANRYNLLVRKLENGNQTRTLAFNSHIDCVAPHFTHTIQGDEIRGRGATDAKGQCTAMLLAAKTLAEVHEQYGLGPNAEICLQFVIDEEIGGNGSLSLALDSSRNYDGVVVCEPTELRLHPAHRGALWYEIDLSCNDPGVNATSVASHVLIQLRADGESLREESSHPLFPHRPVQTCNGVFGEWGEHPSEVCPAVGIVITCPNTLGLDRKKLLTEKIHEECTKATNLYTQNYGDKARGTQPLIDQHFSLYPIDSGIYVEFTGHAGHMGKIRELDCAATKAAYAISSLDTALREYPPGTSVYLARRRSDQEMDDLPVNGIRPLKDSANRIKLEGGQGFLPTHSIDEIREWIRNSVRLSLTEYCQHRGLSPTAVKAQVSFDRLHNDAYECSTESREMVAAQEAARLARAKGDQPIQGFDVSCDARLFANMRSDCEVITFGAGSLTEAHSDNESVDMDQIITCAEVLAYLGLAY